MPLAEAVKTALDTARAAMKAAAEQCRANLMVSLTSARVAGEIDDKQYKKAGESVAKAFGNDKVDLAKLEKDLAKIKPKN